MYFPYHDEFCLFYFLFLRVLSSYPRSATFCHTLGVSIIWCFWCKPVGIHKTLSPARFLVYRRPSIAVKLAWCLILLSTFAHTGSESYLIQIVSKIDLLPSMRRCRSSVCPSDSHIMGSRRSSAFCCTGGVSLWAAKSAVSCCHTSTFSSTGHFGANVTSSSALLGARQVCCGRHEFSSSRIMRDSSNLSHGRSSPWGPVVHQC